MRNWKKTRMAVFAMFLASSAASAGTGVAMLPDGGEHAPDIPKPADVLGFEIGEQHVRHDQLVNYFRVLAEASDRVRIETTGRTHEGREQLLVTISSPENLANLDRIREQHLAIARGERKPGDAPVILWQGYSIHGDESSGSNAAPLYAWHLASSVDPAISRMLDKVVVLIDPSLNPDGMGRYAAWATSRRGATIVPNEDHGEHHQPWPSGRGNHYWFDLNRDWLLLQHPASRHRVDVFRQWRPHVVTDHHEMGADGTFFFQPGVPERTNPLTPKRNQELTGRIAEFHAKHLDVAGRLYYTEESFDDFYYGKGSTYPDITGGIGILFEQASTDGQAIDTPFGVRPFADSVQNQLITSLSTFEAAYTLRDELRSYQAEFFAESRNSADGAWVIGDAGNPARMKAFLDILAGHGIRFRALEERVSKDGQDFRPGHAWVVPMAQLPSRLIEAMFETRTTFPSNVFYDVSTWTLPLAFDLPYARLGSVPDAGAWQDASPSLQGDFRTNADAVAYAFEWTSDTAPSTLQALLAKDVIVMVATRPLDASTPQSTVALERGSMVIPSGVQPDLRADIERILAEAAADGLVVHTLRGGLTPGGIDIGSPSLVPLEPVKPLLVTGRGVSSYEAGETWFVADKRLGLPLTQVNRDRLSRVNLDEYTHIILVGGQFGAWNEGEASRLHAWMQDGGVLVTQQGAADWATDYRLYLSSRDRSDALEAADDDLGAAARDARKAADDKAAPLPRSDYADFDDDYATTLVSGTIFATNADITHPLAYGIPDRTLPVFKDRAETLPVSDNPYATVLQFAEQPLLSGYVSTERLQEIAGSGAMLADRVGDGVLIRMTFDPAFRAYWHGTQRLLVNSLYLAQIVGGTELK